MHSGVRAALLSGGLDAATAAAIAAMTVKPSAGQARVLDTLVKGLKASGVWAKTDWLVLRRIHDAQAARVNIRNPAIIGTIGSGTTFTANSELTFNGSTDYIDDGFNPSTHAVAATGSNLCYWVRETTNVASTARAGAVSQGANKGVLLIPRTAGGVVTSLLDSASVNASVTVSDSRQIIGVQREADDTITTWAAGAALGVAQTPGTTATTLPSINFFSGGYNNAGAVTSPRASHMGAQGFGGRLTSAEWASLNAALEAYLTNWPSS